LCFVLSENAAGGPKPGDDVGQLARWRRSRQENLSQLPKALFVGHLPVWNRKAVR
jgi:hypothetical protein